MLKKVEAYPLDALAAAGGGAILWAGQGTMHARSGNLLGALHCFERALECNVDCLDAWSGLLEVFERMQDRRRAEACLEICRRIRSATARERSA